MFLHEMIGLIFDYEGIGRLDKLQSVGKDVGVKQKVKGVRGALL